MRRRGKTFLSLFLSAVIVTGQPVLAADFSAGEETFISETTEQEGDVSEASAIFEDTVDSDSEMRYEKYEATVSSEILDLGQAGVNGGGWERLEIKNTGTESWQIKSISELNDFRLEHLEHPLLYEGRLPMKVGNKVKPGEAVAVDIYVKPNLSQGILSWKQKKEFRQSAGYGFSFVGNQRRITRLTVYQIVVRDFSQLLRKSTIHGMM